MGTTKLDVRAFLDDLKGVMRKHGVECIHTGETSTESVRVRGDVIEARPLHIWLDDDEHGLGTYVHIYTPGV